MKNKNNLPTKTIAVLFGGCSSEYLISLQSAYAVLSHLDATKYRLIPIGITPQGDWFRYDGAYTNIVNNTWQEDQTNLISVAISPNRSIRGMLEFTANGPQITPLDAVFPVLHGKNGEDGTVQGLLQLANIPLIGCNTLASALCMDKHKAHLLVQAAGIKVPSAIVLDQPVDPHLLLHLTKTLKYPLFVKPVCSGSSFGISKIVHWQDLATAVALAFTYDQQVIIEENIEGFEVGCAILGTASSLHSLSHNQQPNNLIIGRVDEIELTQGFFDYTEKYTLKSSQIYMPARIEPQIEAKIQATAQIIYQTLGCSGFARVDMFLTPTQEIVFNEVNTIPGFTDHSRYPKMMAGIGLSFSQLLDKLINQGTL